MDASEPTPHSDDAVERQAGGWQKVREWIQIIVIALLISLPIRFFVAEPFIVNGASMDPTFSTGQFLIVDRLTYRFESPARGDVIIFQYPLSPPGDQIYYIKRVIGLPGETVSIKDGSVTIITPTAAGSGTTPKTTILDEPYIAPIHASHDSETITLGPTQYFVMGDNRLQSSDSRAWGPLDKRYIIGRPIIRLLPLNTFAVLPGQYHE